MASFNIHLAVGKRYLEKNDSINNEELFYAGIIEPDLVDDKDISHYTKINRNKNNLLEYLEGKVQLNKFIENADLDSDYGKGVFIHLVTDYLYFTSFFDLDYLNGVSYDDFCKDLYYSYDITNNYLESKYKLDYSKFEDKININIQKDRSEKKIDKRVYKNILPNDKLDIFIENVSDINIDDYKNKIKCGSNIQP